MSKLALGSTAAAVVAFALTALTPDTARSQSVFEVCSSEIKSHCSAVLPGDGRLYACLYANEEKLSDACDEATMDVLDQLDLFFELVRYAKQECAMDIEKHCTGVEMGGGKILSCLKSHSADLRNDCTEVINKFNLPEN